MTENALIEPAYITAGKQRVGDLEKELSAAKAQLQAEQTNWKGQLDEGFVIEKDVSQADLIATLAKTQAALEAANTKMEEYGFYALAPEAPAAVVVLDGVVAG